MRHLLVAASVAALALLGCSSSTSGSSGSTGSTGSTSHTTSAGSTSAGTTSAGSTSTGTTSAGTSTGASATSTTGTTGTGTTSTGTTSAGTTGNTLFPSDAPWYQDVSALQKDAQSDAIITDLSNNGGWGNGNVFQIDFSITLQHADANTEFVPWTPTGDWYSPDCDQQDMPLPTGGAVEGEDAYACTQGGDCHLLVIDDVHQKLYENWEWNQTGTNTYESGCQAVWDLTQHYPDNLRGDGCTSADAAGFPIAALLFTADEVAAGHIDHAIRFILPNDRIRHGSYVHPSTHSTNPTAGGPNAPPYGVHLRLRQDFDVSGLSPGAQVVANALKKYGMFLSDGGQIALTAADDRFTTAKWSGLLDAHDLSSIQVTDFEVVNLGTPVPLNDCVRNP
ncbi:MAG: hypothetical protein JST54_15155 [Deltaproteobacteria bacterium]|nr:hypothetical protein [Deltaproteobacteria bacterium]